MSVYETVATKLDLREFSPKKVPADVKAKILEAARLTQSGTNSQHWRFILIQEPGNLRTLANDSTWGKWVEKANFAIIVLTDPKLGYHMIDAGRAIQAMQLTAWSFGVVSCVFTSADETALRRDFSIPQDLVPTITAGFGYPTRNVVGKKNRKPLSEVAFLERYGGKLDPEKLS